ncbi:uncharacterized protein [Amphiura filiformis]|uniref:uncharacterized protein n=1 Tax=Amphiura filiformis TaxID=82378 RepID=UPI003B2252F1
MGTCCSSPKESGGKKKSAQSVKEPYSELKKKDENGHRPSQPKASVGDANANIQQDHADHNDISIGVGDLNDIKEETEPQQEQKSGDDEGEHDGPLTEFGVEGESQGEFKMAKAVAVFLYGDIVVIEHVNERVYLFGKNGIYKQTIASSKDEHREGKLRYPTDIVFTPLGHVAVTDQTRYVKIFNLDGDFLHRFNIKGGDEDPDVKPKGYSLDVAFDEEILVGDIRRKCIIAFKELDAKSEFEKRINLNIEPHFLATNKSDGRRQAIISDWKLGEVNAIDLSLEDSSENVIFKLDSFSIDGKPGLPKGVACDEDNNIYIAMSRTDDTEKGMSTMKLDMFTNILAMESLNDASRQVCCIREVLRVSQWLTLYR